MKNNPNAVKTPPTERLKKWATTTAQTISGSLGKLTLPAICFTIFLSFAAETTIGIRWWVPWLWLTIGITLAITMSRAAVLIKILTSLLITAFMVVGMANIGALASPFTDGYITAGLSPLVALLVYWVLSQFGTWGVSRWTPVPVLMGLAGVTGQIVTAYMLNPILGSVTVIVGFVGVAFFWYRFGVRFFYTPSNMPELLSFGALGELIPNSSETSEKTFADLGAERWAEVVDREAESHDGDWKFIRYANSSKGKKSPSGRWFSRNKNQWKNPPLMVVGERAYMFFPVRLTSEFTPERSGWLWEKGLARRPRSVNLMYRGKKLEPWLFDKVISRTPNGVIPILVDVNNACFGGEKAEAKRIEVATPDSMVREDGSPTSYLHVGVIAGNELKFPGKRFPLVARAESMYSKVPPLSRRRQQKLLPESLRTKKPKGSK